MDSHRVALFSSRGDVGGLIDDEDDDDDDDAITVPNYHETATIN